MPCIPDEAVLISWYCYKVLQDWFGVYSVAFDSAILIKNRFSE